MTDLRIWTTLTPAERSEAIEKAKGIITGGETRWHVVARLCGIKGGIPLRTALDEGWRARKKALDAERYRRQRGERPAKASNVGKTEKQQMTARERGQPRATIASAIAKHEIAPITLPKLSFLEKSTWQERLDQKGAR